VIVDDDDLIPRHASASDKYSNRCSKRRISSRCRAKIQSV